MRRALVACLLLILTSSAPAAAASVPPNLIPSLANAQYDKPIPYSDGCNVTPIETNYHHCNYGPSNASIRIALFGDSHAGAWFPALRHATRLRGWRLDLYQRSACPAPDVKTYNAQTAQFDVDCANFRQHALADMRADPPTLVLITDYANAVLYDANDQPIPASERDAEWAAGMVRTFNGLPSSTRILVLADTPLPQPIDVVKCLQAHLHDIASCERPASQWINAAHQRTERVTTRSHGGMFASLNRHVCPGNPCPVIIGRILLFRDDSHMTATFARSLATPMGNLIDASLRT
jgi:hypothetical protein